MHKTEYQANDFRVEPTDNRMLDGIMITPCLRQNFPWVIYRMSDEGKKDRGPLGKLQGDPGDRQQVTELGRLPGEKKESWQKNTG